MVNPTMELGVFLAMLIIPFLHFVFIVLVKQWSMSRYILFSISGILGFLMLGGLALAMISNNDVVISEMETFRDANGTLTGTVAHSTPVINQLHYVWAIVFAGLAIIFGLLTIFIMATGGGIM